MFYFQESWKTVILICPWKRKNDLLQTNFYPYEQMFSFLFQDFTK